MPFGEVSMKTRKIKLFRQHVNRDYCDYCDSSDTRIISNSGTDWWEVSEVKFQELSQAVWKANLQNSKKKVGWHYFIVEQFTEEEDAYGELFESVDAFVKAEKKAEEDRERRKKEEEKKKKERALARKKKQLEKLKKELE